MQNYKLRNNIGIPCLTRAQMGPEIAERIRCARQWFQRHGKLLCSPDLTSQSKFEIYKAFIRPILTYACELWDLSAYESKKLLRCESEILVEIYKSKYPQRHPKRLKPCLRAVYKRFRASDVVDYVNYERLRWTDLLKHEESALRNKRERAVRFVRWWDKLCVRCKTRSKQSSRINMHPSKSKNEAHNVEHNQSLIIKNKDDDVVPG